MHCFLFYCQENVYGQSEHATNPLRVVLVHEHASHCGTNYAFLKAVYTTNLFIIL